MSTHIQHAVYHWLQQITKKQEKAYRGGKVKHK